MQQRNIVHQVARIARLSMMVALTVYGLTILELPQNVAAASTPSTSTPIQRSEFGVNVGTWDPMLLDPSTPKTIEDMGFGVQQFPNMAAWNWKTDTSRNAADGYKSWNTFKDSVSLDKWGAVLRKTGTQGLYIVDYGTNSTWTGGATVDSAKEVTQYILDHNIPVKAMVIGSEQYGSWTIDLHKQRTPQEYASVAKQMAQAIHSVDPHMLVGVDITVGNDGNMTPEDVLWDQTVLREDAPYIQFLSVHSYLNGKPLSNTQLMASLGKISTIMDRIHSLMSLNAPADANHIQIWITEFNIYAQEPPQTIQPVYGSALIESMLRWIAAGATQVDWWSLHGDAHQWLPNGTVDWQHNDLTPGTKYGVFSLVANGVGPQPSVNTMFPSGVAYAKLMHMIGNGGQLSTGTLGNVFYGTISTGSDVQTVLVNNSGTQQGIQVGGKTVSIAPTSYKIVSGEVSSSPSPVQGTNHGSATGMYLANVSLSTPGPSLKINAVAKPPVPKISSVSTQTIEQGSVVTLHGTGFGNYQGTGYVYFRNDGWQWGAPKTWKLKVVSWDDNTITFNAPSAAGPYATHSLKPGTSALIQVVTSQGLVSDTTKVDVSGANVPTISGTSGTALPGRQVTLKGTNFGNYQGSGYVYFSDDNQRWGAPTFWKLNITSWSDSQITFELPTMVGSNATHALKLGSTAQVRIVNDAGQPSEVMPLHINTEPTPNLASIKGKISSGNTVTLSGENFGSEQGQGYVLLMDNGVTWGKPHCYKLQIVSWSDNQIQVELPSGTGAHATAPLKIGTSATFAVLQSNGAESSEIQEPVE